MSHPNPSGNGCSLEDCHTNLFALTDLSGIKWRKFTVDSVVVDLLDDPVLVSYCKCIQSDILCVWRKTQRNTDARLGPDHHVSFPKELWIFWYGDQPHNLRNLISPELKEEEDGSWESGLSYQCRTLLFKALHNLIERCLMTRGFVRLGKWFVQPFDPLSTATDKSSRLSFCFHFFLHGESTVCASIEVNQHPAVSRLTPQSRVQAQGAEPHTRVILAPHGLEGILTGQTYRDNDHSSIRLLEEWNQFYPLEGDSQENGYSDGYSTNKMPSLVEVIVAGVRMRYPTSYVLVYGGMHNLSTNMGPQHGRSMSHMANSPLTPPASPADSSLLGLLDPFFRIGASAAAHQCSGYSGFACNNGVSTQDTHCGISDNNELSAVNNRIVSKISQDACLTAGVMKRPAECAHDENHAGWDFSEPHTKLSCGCSRQKIAPTKTKLGSGGLNKNNAQSGGSGPAGKHGKAEKTEKLERQASRSNRLNFPFHRRSPVTDDTIQMEIDLVVREVPSNPAFRGGSGGGVGGAVVSQGNSHVTSRETGAGGTAQTSAMGNSSSVNSSSNSTSNSTLPFLRNNNTPPSSSHEHAVDSPSSAPSPLDEPPPDSGGQAIDPSMPTLSPHPPSSKSGSCNGPGLVLDGKDGVGGGMCHKDVSNANINGLSMSGSVNSVNSGAVNSMSLTSLTNVNSNTKGGDLGSDSGVFCNGSVDNVFGSASGDLIPHSESLTVSPQSQSAMVTQHVLEHKPFETVSNGWLQSQTRLDWMGLKRPSLPICDGEDESLVTESLYEYKHLQSWIDFPLKKVKIESCAGDNKSPLSYSSQSFNTPFGQSNAFCKQTPKPETPQTPAPDPYEFSDESSIDPCPAGLGRYRNSRDELFPRQSPFGRMEEESKSNVRPGGEVFNFNETSQVTDTCMGSLGSPPTPGMGNRQIFREIGGVTTPGYQDLENMFDTSDEDNDDVLQPPTPSSGHHDDLMGKGNKSSGPNSNGPGAIGALELARMFPTPPSLETNAALSPGMMIETAMEATMIPVDLTCVKQEYKTQIFTEVLTKDVFKPAAVAHFVSSTKYAPVELPSDQLSPLPSPPEFKPSWMHMYGMPMPAMEKHHAPPPNPYINLPSVENVPSLPRSHGVASSPAAFHGTPISQQRTPLSYELQSPASNASSYMNKNLNSIDNQGTNNQMAEVHSVVVNVILSDSILNLFKDHNFDSCNICVCNMNIKGGDVGVYLPDVTPEDEGYRCTCAFSAIMNRKYGRNSGLFYEDEVDITGIRDDRFDRRKPSLLSVPYHKQISTDSKDSQSSGGSGAAAAGAAVEDDCSVAVMELLAEQYSVSIPSSCVMMQQNKILSTSATSPTVMSFDANQVQDGNDVAYAALEQGRQAMEHCTPAKLDDTSMKASCLSRWPFLHTSGRVPVNSQDMVRLLKSLLPLLQDAIQKKRTSRLLEHTYSVTGPLSWKDFHKLTGRGKAESCEPQPIPSFLVGYDKDWMSLSPYSIKYWDKLLLEPYGRPRDICYVVVSPDNDYILDHVRRFFCDLSTTYEICRLGRHCPIPEKLRDGILRVGEKAQEVLQSPMDEWFKQIGESPVAAKLKLYAQACRYLLGPILSAQTLDRNMFEKMAGAPKSMYRPEPSPKPPPTPDGQATNSNSNEDQKDAANSDTQEQQQPPEQDSDPSDVPALVVYIVDPFTYTSEVDSIERLSMLGLLNCFQAMVQLLPEHLQPNVHLQLVPLKLILERQESGSENQYLKALAFSVFTASRWNLSHVIPGRALTGFGPAAAAKRLLMKREVKKMSHLYAPPFILAPAKDKQSLMAESCGEKGEMSNVIFCGYCLSEDQRWLIASCTDECGELLETVTINIEIPNRNRRKKASARWIGLSRLWNFLVGIVLMTTIPCRLVIGRLGRIGHGELKGWAGLLSRKNLIKTSKYLKESCDQCSLMAKPISDTPGLISACLISLEPHASFSVLTDCLKVEEKRSSNCPLQTPRDASCTHILVFPTSTSAQANTQASTNEQNMGLGFGFFENVADVEDENNLLDSLHGLQDDFLDSFFGKSFSPTTSPISSPHHDATSGPGSPGMLGENNGRNSPAKMNGPTAAGGAPPVIDPQDEPPNLLQQPLAMGFYLSTAQTGPLPKWFYAACPDNTGRCPAILKSALHIHSSVLQNPDEIIGGNHSNRNLHPLDSNVTCDVLRYVLENYNALSWLTMDPAQNDRRSCLPIHFVVLMQLYHALNSFV